MARKLFCELGPTAYRISTQKEILLRDLKDLPLRGKFAREKGQELLPVKIKHHASLIRRRLGNVDMRLQENKAVNLALAAPLVDRVLIRPGEIFSFWRLVGEPSARKGYQDGLTIASGTLGRSVGGGLCQLANLIHYLVLHSPLTVTELHHHSDALFPDDRRRVPFGTGTSIFYPHVDYRFRNDTDQPVQLRVWLDEDDLCGELRGTALFPLRYRLREEGSSYVREGEEYYRVSQVYRITCDRATGAEVGRELLLDNHSKVLFDPALIPADQMLPC